MDPRDEGVSRDWFEAGAYYPDTIRVPGNWQAQGFGEPGKSDKVGGGWWVTHRTGGITRHDYQGVAWFKKTFSVPPEWLGKRIWLRFEGVCNHGDVYLNGRKIGRVMTFITPYEFDITGQVLLHKENVLVCRVDSRCPGEHPQSPETKDPIFYAGMMQFLVRAGGLTSHVFLQARPDPKIDDAVFRSSLTNRTVQARLRFVRQQTGSDWEGQAAIQLRPKIGPGSAARTNVSVHLSADATQSEIVDTVLSLPDLHPWSPEAPFLYLATITLSHDEQVVDQLTIQTGFRELIATPEGNFLLNGKPYFLRGAGYDSFEPITGTPAPDKKVFAERLRLLKRYGFNFIRFLAHSPLREFYEAADEEGFLLQTEGEWFLGGSPMTKATGKLLADQVPRMIREFRHHPSWYAFSCFNEANPSGDPVKRVYVQAAYQAFRESAPTVFFVASDGGGDQWPTDVITDRSAMDKADRPDASTSATQYLFQGALDEVAIFARGISAEAMRDLAEKADPVAYQNTVNELQPLAYWQFEETESGRIRDSSGQGHEGSYAPTADPAALGCEGVIGRALACGSGPKAVPGVSLEPLTTELVPQMQKSFSLSLWVKPEKIALQDYGTFFSCGAADTGRGMLLALDGQHGDGRVLLGRYWNNILTSIHPLRVGQWNHLGLTYDGRRIHMFINGLPDAEIEATFAFAPCDLALGRLIQKGSRSAADYSSRPHVWHEFDNNYFAPLPDLEIEKRLTGAITQGWVLEPHRRRLEAYGLLSRYPELRKCSIDLYREYTKQAFERARRMPRLDGYAWWLASDMPAGVETDVTGFGILDMLYQPEKYAFDEFRKFNRESVLTIDADIDHGVLASGEHRPIQVSLSHYGNEPVTNGRLLWRISSGSSALKEGALQPINAQTGKITTLGPIPMGPFDVTEPLSLHLEVELVSDACCQSNDWKFWVFPERKKNLPSAPICNLTDEPSLDARYGPCVTRSMADAQLVLARRLTPNLLRYLEEGGRIILLEHVVPGADTPGPNQDSGFLRTPGKLTYWPLWLRCDAQIVEDHPALAAFPHEGFADYQLMRLYGPGTSSVDFSPNNSMARDKIKPIIWALYLAPWTEDASAFNFALTWHGLVSECRIEKGRAILCTLRVLDGVASGLPEAGYLLDCLVDYALSDRFRPANPAFTSEEAHQFFKID
ncbi:MAG: hypothetical protein M1608_05695 [Candidatus Omnitrophica bacterium]|nr:hypothetical protein [Candidatus Omnitrophota bacterium]